MRLKMEFTSAQDIRHIRDLIRVARYCNVDVRAVDMGETIEFILIPRKDK